MKNVKLGGGILLESNDVKVKIKRLSQFADIPQYSRNGDAAVDLVATEITDSNDMFIEFGTSLAVEIPKGYAGFILPRSSVSKYDLLLCNSLGLIDSNYRGEIKVRFKQTIELRNAPDYMHQTYKVGDRIAQLLILPVPEIKFEEVEELEETNRGDGAFGSSGV
jgi:dUTP pyrophosphatase